MELGPPSSAAPLLLVAFAAGLLSRELFARSERLALAAKYGTCAHGECVVHDFILPAQQYNNGTVYFQPAINCCIPQQSLTGVICL